MEVLQPSPPGTLRRGGVLPGSDRGRPVAVGAAVDDYPCCCSTAGGVARPPQCRTRVVVGRGDDHWLLSGTRLPRPRLRRVGPCVAHEPSCHRRPLDEGIGRVAAEGGREHCPENRRDADNHRCEPALAELAGRRLGCRPAMRRPRACPAAGSQQWDCDEDGGREVAPGACRQYAQDRQQEPPWPSTPTRLLTQPCAKARAVPDARRRLPRLDSRLDDEGESQKQGRSRRQREEVGGPPLGKVGC